MIVKQEVKNWWESLSTNERQGLTNSFYCKFSQVLWSDVIFDHKVLMFQRNNK